MNCFIICPYLNLYPQTTSRLTKPDCQFAAVDTRGSCLKNGFHTNCFKKCTVVKLYEQVRSDPSLCVGHIQNHFPLRKSSSCKNQLLLEIPSGSLWKRCRVHGPVGKQSRKTWFLNVPGRRLLPAKHHEAQSLLQHRELHLVRVRRRGIFLSHCNWIKGNSDILRGRFVAYKGLVNIKYCQSDKGTSLPKYRETSLPWSKDIDDLSCTFVLFVII